MRAISILLNDLRMMLKEPFAFTVLLVVPMALMGPALLNYQSGGGETLDATPLVVANYDTGQVSLHLIKELEGSLTIEQNISGDILRQYTLQADARCAQPSAACDEAVGRSRLADQSRPAILIIPEGLTAAFDAGEQTPVTLLYDPGSDAIKLTQIEKVCQGLAIKVALIKELESAKGDFTDLSSIGSPEVRAEVANITSQPAAKNNKTAIHVDEVSPSSYKEKKSPGLLGAPYRRSRHPVPPAPQLRDQAHQAGQVLDPATGHRLPVTGQRQLAVYGERSGGATDSRPAGRTASSAIRWIRPSKRIAWAGYSEYQ